MEFFHSSHVPSNRSIASCTIQTPLGAMIAIADTHTLLFLSFLDAPRVEERIATFKKNTNSTIEVGLTMPLVSITDELTNYFAGTLQTFKTSLTLYGSPFQQKTCRALQSIPYGHTRSYRTLAQSIGSANGFRAVAQANSKNQLALIIPCHRVINKSGATAGYYGGVERKVWLLEHEKEVLKKEIL